MRYVYFFLVLFVLSMGVSAQEDESIFGVQTHFGQFYRPDMTIESVDSMLSLIQEAGIKTIRDECYWMHVEQTLGVYTFPEIVDHYVTKAQELGIQVLMILDYNNVLYAEHTNRGISDSVNLQAYVHYCKAVVEHYTPMGVKHYELWNEPNIPIFWQTTPSAEEYTNLVKATYPEIKAIDSTITVIGCATSPAEGEPAPFIDWVTFITDVYELGGGDYMDAVSFHLYRPDRAPDLWLYDDMETIQQIVGTEKPLYITETGYHTSTVWPQLSLTDQRDYVMRLFTIGRTFPQLKLISYYDFKNDCTDPGYYECNWGLVDYSLKPKPAYIAYKTLTEHTADLPFAGMDESLEGTNSKAFIFSDGADTSIVLWRTSGTGTYTYTTNKEMLKLIDASGKTSYFSGDTFTIEIPISATPKILTTKFDMPVIDTLTIQPDFDTLLIGGQLHLYLEGKTANDESVHYDPASIEWTFSSDGFATISDSSVITATARGNVEVSATKHDVSTSKLFYIFSSYSDLIVDSFFGTIEGVKLDSTAGMDSAEITLVDSVYLTNEGALHLDYSFTYKSLAGHSIFLQTDYELPGAPDTLGLYIYNNANAHAISYQFEDVKGRKFTSTPTQIDATEGWALHSIALSQFAQLQYPCKLKLIRFYAVEQNATKDVQYSGEVLLDDIYIVMNDVTSVKNDETFSPKNIVLHQNFPNPFNPSTSISFSLPKSEYVSLKLFSIRGEEIASLLDDQLEAGNHTIKIGKEITKGLSTGIYFYQLVGHNFSKTKKMLLLK